MTAEPEAPQVPPAPAPSPASTDAAAAGSTGRSYAPLFMKGCGFTLLAIVLAVAVLVASKGDFAAIGSALFGVVFLLLILSSSGVTGFWSNKS